MSKSIQLKLNQSLKPAFGFNTCVLNQHSIPPLQNHNGEFSMEKKNEKDIQWGICISFKISVRPSIHPSILPIHVIDLEVNAEDVLVLKMERVPGDFIYIFCPSSLIHTRFSSVNRRQCELQSAWSPDMQRGQRKTEFLSTRWTAFDREIPLGFPWNRATSPLIMSLSCA